MLTSAVVCSRILECVMRSRQIPNNTDTSSRLSPSMPNTTSSHTTGCLKPLGNPVGIAGMCRVAGDNRPSFRETTVRGDTDANHLPLQRRLSQRRSSRQDQTAEIAKATRSGKLLATAGKKLSQIEASVAVLKTTRASMIGKPMIEAMLARKLGFLPRGQTPESPATTLRSFQELTTKNKDAWFVEAARSRFALDA